MSGVLRKSLLAGALFGAALLAACTGAAQATPTPTRPAATATTAPTATAAPSAANAAGGAKVQAKDDPKLGRILTDGAGKTLYIFDRDQPGVSNCNDTCLKNWPALLQPSGDASLASGLPGKLGIITRTDGGGRQVTYDDKPLYYYAADAAAGDTKGDGVGNVWHVIKVGQTGGAQTGQTGVSGGGSSY